MGIGISTTEVEKAARLVGCSTFITPFKYLGFKVGDVMSRINYWDEVIFKLSSRLSKWKLKTLSTGCGLTLLKSVLTSIPLYHMSIFKVRIGVLNKMESIRDAALKVQYPRLYALELHKDINCWVWSLESLGEFSVKSIHNLTDDTLLQKEEVPIRWVKAIPIKVNILAWRVQLDKLPTQLNISLRGVEIPSILFPSCQC
ncbi:hypothetical protein Tco_0909021 [Tanacetum coccineum]|uniref:Reverse transcriptase zinc-binding domain-containing protein n=1 Tax=Tanacetum coccineum TaxID=301880 RepID=A0ABQ5CNS8_9ASTR